MKKIMIVLAVFLFAGCSSLGNFGFSGSATSATGSPTQAAPFGNSIYTGN